MTKFIVLEKMSLLQFMIKMKEFNYAKRRGTKLVWQRFIEQNKLTCPITGKTVAYCRYEKSIHDGSYVYNFYSEDGELFDIDHIIPKSKGGSRRSLTNLQPMISKYNKLKADKLDFSYGK